jgi:hypothetical protein
MFIIVLDFRVKKYISTVFRTDTVNKISGRNIDIVDSVVYCVGGCVVCGYFSI